MSAPVYPFAKYRTSSTKNPEEEVFTEPYLIEYGQFLLISVQVTPGWVRRLHWLLPHKISLLVLDSLVLYVLNSMFYPNCRNAH